MRVPILASFIVFALVTAAHGQTSRQLVTNKPAETYSYFKRALGNLNAGSAAANIRKEDNFVPLTSCNDSTDYVGYDRDENSILQKTANLAYDVLYMQAVLRVAGYPQNLWMPDLVEYERSNLAAIDQYDDGAGTEGTPAKKRLAKKLNDYKKNSNGRYKDVIPQGEGCGAGEVRVTIRTTPSAQRVEYINVVKYNLCGIQGLDPKGPNCNLWLDYSADASDGAQMSGKYKIRATWSDGTTAFRDLDVDNLVEDRNGGYSFSISKR
ncbi:MAG: hypothetical protein QOJ84_77 [Bradyrhizobium sp.]|nr:hypothetical protein [Bradyrhizobium sp.]